MNNERGEISLVASIILSISFSLLVLLSFKLETHHRDLKNKLRLDLCAKEVLGLSESYWVDMSKMNWAIENATKVQVVAAVIPGLQGVAMKVSKVKKALKHLQEARTVSYLIYLTKLRGKYCPIPAAFFKTPFEYENFLFKRNAKGVIKMRDRSWNSNFLSGPYFLRVSYQLPELKVLHPRWRKNILASKVASP